jgi:hypothetical protein
MSFYYAVKLTIIYNLHKRGFLQKVMKNVKLSMIWYGLREFNLFNDVLCGIFVSIIFFARSFFRSAFVDGRPYRDCNHNIIGKKFCEY